MALIDCLAVINGHMLKHAHAGHSYTDVRRQFEREGVSSSLEKHLSLALEMEDGGGSAALDRRPLSRPAPLRRRHQVGDI